MPIALRACRPALLQRLARCLCAALVSAAALLCLAPDARGQDGAWTLRSASGGPAPRAGHALAYDSHRNRVVLFGGYDGTARRGDTWEWNGLAWTQRASSGPSPRTLGPALAYDSRRRRMVLFGGFDGQYQGDTWEWDGVAWTQRAAGGPPARNGHALAYDAARGRVLLFGGGGGADDTWEWDGSLWTQVASGGPSGRGGHGLAYDGARDRTLVFGGRFGNEYRADTWEWDGRAWSQVSTSGPPARYQHALCYDMARRRSLLFGGYSFGTTAQYHADTWEWDGAAWVQQLASGPSAREGHALAYDASRDRLVLFGGTNGAQHFGETWEWSWTYQTEIVEGYLVNAPNGSRLWVKILQPRASLYPGRTFPAVVWVPGGTGAGATGNLQMAAGGFVEFHFNAQGRGVPPRRSDGVEDYNGFVHQDDLKAVIEYAHTRPNVRHDNLGVMTSSYGITMGAGCLGRHPDLQVKYLLDIEGPSDSFVTSGEPWSLDSDPSNDRLQATFQVFGHWSIYRDASPANVAWWSEREATRYIGAIRSCYLRVQAQWDHFQPPNAQWPGFDYPPLWYPNKHAVDLVNLATAGSAAWTRVNGILLGNAPNVSYDHAQPPAYYPGSYGQGGGGEDQRLLRELAACVSCPGGATAFCFGDGSGTPCPCANHSAPGGGAGCLNSLGVGARLVAVGAADVANDTLILLGSSMPDSAVLYFQGTAQHGGGLGAVFGDGLRCAGGSVIRLGTKTNSGGASQYPADSDLPIHVRGGVPAGAVRTYQCWYRNAASFCTSATYNLTNGLSVPWAP